MRNCHTFTLLKINFMSLQNLPLVSWSNGAFMIAIFAIVCILLIGAVLVLVIGGKGKPKKN